MKLFLHIFFTAFFLITTSVFAAHKPFPQSVNFPGTIKPDNLTSLEMNKSVEDFFQLWRDRFIKESNGVTPGGGYYVEMQGTGGDGNEKTTSEALGYGMIICVLMSREDDVMQSYFDGLYNMCIQHRSTINRNLMTWKIDESEELSLDSDSATDGDLDIAYALLLAHVQWGSDGVFNYLAEAQRILNDGIKAGEISSISLRTKLGDWDEDPWASRASDWMTDHFHAFYNFTEDPFWLKVADKVYEMIASLTADKLTTGLLPDFIVGEVPQPALPDTFEMAGDGDYSWNACRIPWRLALDFAHYGDRRSLEALNNMLNWIKRKTDNDPGKITAGYKLDGTAVNDYSDNAFTAPIVAAAIVDSQHQSYLDSGWPLLSEYKNSYYSDTLSLLSMLVISGNWWRPEVKKNEISFHVAIDGDDANPGTLSHPWRTIQKSADSATVGSTVYIHGGRYFESVEINVSGTEGHCITWCNYNDVPVLIDGSQAVAEVLFKISGQSYIKIKGLHLTNFSGNDRDGVRIENGSSFIEFSGNKISEIHFNNNSDAAVTENTNARPFIVLGNNSTHPCREINILNNEIFSCRTGYSEGLSLNGNVDKITVNYNLVHDITNIGIDFIGHEETASDEVVDQVRNGLCAYNTVYNCQSPYALAAGIYVDGARQIIIENNRVYNCQWGVEIGCEHPGKSAADITVRNNILYNNRAAGIACGGYDYPNLSGTVTDCLISNNTCYQNDLDHDWNAELNFSHAESCRVTNNIFVSDKDNLLIFMDTPPDLGNRFDYNLWYRNDSTAPFFAVSNGVEFQDFENYKRATGQDKESLNLDPLMFDPGSPTFDFHLTANSSAIDLGDPGFVPDPAETDFYNGVRVVGERIDIGADEYDVVGRCPSPVVKVGNIYYETVSDAFFEVKAGETVFVKADNYTGPRDETLLFSHTGGLPITLSGGCDCDFIPGNNRMTSFSALIISAGTLVVENLEIGLVSE